MILLLCLVLAYASAQNTGVPEYVVVNGANITNNLTYPSTKITLISHKTSTQMNVYFDIDDTNNKNITNPNFTMLIEINQPYWFSFAIGGSMNDADMWIFSINNDSSMNFVDGFGKNYSGPCYDNLIGGENNMVPLGYNHNASGITVKFQRLLNTGDQYDFSADPGFKGGVLAYGVPVDYELAYHQNHYAVFSFDFVNGQNQVIHLHRDYWTIHVYINIIVWGILVDIPVMFARYFKTYNWYIKAHGIILTLMIFASIVAEALMIYTNTQNYKEENFEQIGKNSQVHLVFGTMILFLIFIQLSAGWFLSWVISDPKKIKNDIVFSKKTHAISGIFIYLLCKINVVTGALISFSTFTWVEGLIYGVYFATLFYRIVFEILYQMKSGIMMSILRLNGNFTPEYDIEGGSSISKSSVAKLMNAIELLDFEQLENEMSDKKWMIFNNSVIRLTNELHPGGQFIWEQCQGREVSRFIFGAYALECTTLSPYKHSEYALKMIEKFTIGKLRVVQLFSEEMIDFSCWRIANMTSFTSTIKMFEFTRNGINFQTTLYGIENFGRHFLLRSTRNNTISTRHYTMVLCMAKPNQQWRWHMISTVGRQLSINGLPQDVKKVQFQQTYTDFPLIIKRYASKTGFSQYVHNLDVGDEVELCGPFGTSFGINHQEKGTVVLVAAGTGLFPFLDLLDFLLKKTICSLVDQVTARELNPSQINYDRFFQPGFKIVLILSVAAQEDLIGSDIYFTLCRLQKFLKQPNFEMILSSSFNPEGIPGMTNAGKTRFDQAFFNKNLDIRAISRVLICGPPNLNLLVPQALSSLGLSKNKIHLV